MPCNLLIFRNRVSIKNVYVDTDAKTAPAIGRDKPIRGHGPAEGGQRKSYFPVNDFIRPVRPEGGAGAWPIAAPYLANFSSFLMPKYA